MIDIDRVRLWSVFFFCIQSIDGLPYPNCIVEEREGKGYRIPQNIDHVIPKLVGGQLTITLSGRGVLQVGQKHYDLLPGTAFIYRDCDQNVSYYCPDDAEEKWHFIWINFSGAESERLISIINRHYGYFFDLHGDKAIEKELMSYRDFSGQTLMLTPFGAAKIAMDIFNNLCRSSAEAKNSSGEFDMINKVHQLMANSFGETVSTVTLASKLGISREHLSRLYHAKTGSTIKEYQMEQRMTEALTLLQKTSMTCKEIAYHCHFESYSSFFRNFRKVYNISPALFRKKKK